MRNSNKIVRRLSAVFAALVILAAGFAAGYFTRKLTQGGALNSLEWVLNLIDENYLGDFDEGAAVNGSLAEIAAGLDPYSEYYTKEEYAAQLRENSGERSGIGISYNFIEGVGVRLISVVGNSPAWHKGLRAGDEIVSGSYDGVEADFTAYIENNGVKKDPFSAFMGERGAGEVFTLNVKGKTGAENAVELSKQVYNSSYTFMATKNSAWEFISSADGSGLSLKETSTNAIGFLPDDAAYINVSQFFGTAGSEFGVLMEEFNSQSLKKLIIDLRNNGGGYVSTMQEIAGYFTSSLSNKTYVAMTAKYKSGKTETYNCRKYSGDSVVKEGTEVYVLANSNTASASEALIGALISYKFLEYENVFISDYAQEYIDWAKGGNADAEIKTARTYGKGIMQTTFVNYYTGEALKLTTAKIYWPNGNCIHDVGLNEESGCTIVDGVEWTATRGDGELKKVCEIIEGRG